MAEYKDPTPISPRNIEYDLSKVDSRVKNYADQVRHKKNGLTVREAQARNAEIASVVSTEANERSKLAEEVARIIEERYKEQILAQDLNPNKDPELVDLREGFDTAGERIKKFETDTTAQLAKKAPKTFITPEGFGASGNGIVDDTISLTLCIGYSIYNGVPISCEASKQYKITSKLMIEGAFDVNWNGATIVLAGLEAEIFVNHDSVNRKSGLFENVKIDCVGVANVGLHIKADRRRIYRNVFILNVANTGLLIEDGNVCKFSYVFIEGKEGVIETKAIRNEASDMVFDNIDWIGCKYGIDHAGGNCFYTEAHGFIRDMDQYEGSYFFKQSTTASVFLDRCYPDTQQKAYYITNVARLKLSQNYYYVNRDYVTEQVINDYGRPILFYFEYSTPISATEHITLVNNSFFGLEINNNPFSAFSNLNEFFIRMDNSNSFRGFIDAPRGAYYQTMIISNSVLTKNRATLGLETLHLDLELVYNPSVRGKMSRTSGIQVCNLRNNRVKPKEAIIFTVPYGYGVDISGIQYEGNLLCVLNTDNTLTLKAMSSDFENNRGICDVSKNTNFRIPINITLPSL